MWLRVGRRPDISALGDDDLERLDQLDRKGRGLPQDEPWAGMAHRGPEIGPCRCAGCAQTAVPGEGGGYLR
jgi:hypothetical protein